MEENVSQTKGKREIKERLLRGGQAKVIRERSSCKGGAPVQTCLSRRSQTRTHAPTCIRNMLLPRRSLMVSEGISIGRRSQRMRGRAATKRTCREGAREGRKGERCGRRNEKLWNQSGGGQRKKISSGTEKGARWGGGANGV
eukprot:1255809-Pleurochrysis_carterae.AAC.1